MKEVITLGTKIKTLKGFAFKSEWFKENGIPVVKVSNFTEDSIAEDVLNYIPESIANNYKKYKIYNDDIIIQTVGSWPSNPKSVVGKVIRVPKKFNGALLNQNAVKIIPEKEIDNKFLFYCLKDISFSGYIINCAQGAANQASITLESIKAYKLYLPNLRTQQKTASILSAYDDLIENNTHRIKILEEMAQTIYKEWFVNFRFPGYENVKFVNSSLGKIPEGWEVKSLNEISHNSDSKRKPISSLKRKEMQGEYPYYGAAKVIDHVNDFIFDGKYLLLAEDGSVITNDNKPVMQFVNEKFWANNHTHILKGKDSISTEFLFLFLSQYNISGHITGVAQPKINQENLNRIKVPIAIAPVMKMFNYLVIPKFDLRNFLLKKNQNLRKTRDLLLPKLMSGEVEV